MIYCCPICGHEFNAVELQRPSGVGGGNYCPKCNGRVRIVIPYAKAVGILSLLLAAGALYEMGVRSKVWFVVGTIIVWIPLSMLLNVYSMRLKPFFLKKWEPRKPQPRKPHEYRSFFEWLYERDRIRAPELDEEEQKK